MGNVKEIGENLFQEEVLESQLPVLVDFWAPWCGPCRMVAPVMEELAEKYGNRLKVVKVNVDDNNELASRYGVMSIPTIKLFKSGSEVENFIGAQPKDAFSERLDRHL